MLLPNHDFFKGKKKIPECAPWLIITYHFHHFGPKDNPSWDNTVTLNAVLQNRQQHHARCCGILWTLFQGDENPPLMPGLALTGTASAQDAPLGTGEFAQVCAWPQASWITSTSVWVPALGTSAEQARKTAPALQSRCIPPFWGGILLNACIGRSVQLPPTHRLLAHPMCTWISFCSGKPLCNVVTPAWQQSHLCPGEDARAAPSPRLPRTCRSRLREDALVPVGCQTGGAERSFSSNGCSLQTLGYPQQAWWVPQRWQPCSPDQLLRSFPTAQLHRKPLSKPFSSKNNLYKYFPKQTRPTVRYSPKKLSKEGARLY